MKKFMAVLICMLLFTVCLVSCGKGDEPKESNTVESMDTATGGETNEPPASDTNPPDTGDNGGKNEAIGEAGGENNDDNWTKPY